jgi:fatty-acyl-CoA synthase
MSLVRRLLTSLWVFRVLVRAGMIPLMRPDKYVRQGLAIRRHGAGPLSGLSLSAVRSPGGLALVDERGPLTWRELDRRADAVAVGLAELGADRSAPVGILCRNHRGLVESLAATSRLGADALLLNTGFSGPQLSEVMSREGARVLVCDEEFLPLAEQARSSVDGLVTVLAWTDGSVDSVVDREVDAPSLDALVEEHLGSRPPAAGTAGRVVLLTSGTTGTPKGARRGASGGGVALAAMFDRVPWRAEEPIVVAAPAFHAFGFGAVAIAFTLSCPVVMRRRFDPETTLDLLVRHDATGLAVVPVMIERIADLPAEVLDRYRPSHLRFVTASGSRMRPDAVLGFMDRFGEVIYNSYNATEPGLISTATPADLRAAPDTAGRPMAGSEVLILDDELEPVPAGEIGRIAVFNGAQFEGYTSGDTKEFHGRHMFSGDLGRFDADGRLYVVGRDDDMIVSGGENVYPLEVEQCLGAHEDVLECAVVGVEDDKFGQRLAAYVVLRDGASVSPDELKAHVKANLAGYKVPRDVELLDELPRNASGKVLTRELGS